MRVAVIGAGGVGGLYGAVLARAGHDVRFLARSAHLAAIRERGLQIRSTQFGTFTVQAPASRDAKDLGQVELALFTVKTYDLPQAAEAAKHVLQETDSMLLTFQNGLDAPDQVAEIVGPEHVLIGTSSLETYVAEPGVIVHPSAFHVVTVSELNGPPTPRVQRVEALLREAGINVRIAADGRQALWQKAWHLIPIATITSVCQSPMGPIKDVPETGALVETLLVELGSVARACGYELPEALANARRFVAATGPGFTASMARDFERGRPTELEALTGALVRLADARGVDVPATRTAYAILKLREHQRGLAAPAEATRTLGSASAGR
jgi:2-dehydropantoate 2-reductase